MKQVKNKYYWIWPVFVMATALPQFFPAYWHPQTEGWLESQWAITYDGGDPLTWPRHTFVDIDNDGDLDLFIGQSNGRIIFYKNVGMPQEAKWEKITDYYAEIDVGFNAAPTFVDIDNDGDPDLFLGKGANGCNGGTIRFYRNNGIPDSANWEFVTDTFANVINCDYTVPTFVDIDNDGDYDIFTGGGFGRIVFNLNNGTADSAIWDSVGTTLPGIAVGFKSTPAFCDVNNDGKPDLFIGNDRGQLFHYENVSTDTSIDFSLITREYAGINFGHLDYVTPVFADLNSDGKKELYLSEHFGNINLYQSFGAVDSLEWEWITGDYLGGSIDIGQWSTPTLADIDQDGDLDLLIGKANGRIRFYRNIGNSFEPHWQLETDFFLDIDVGGLWTNSSTPFLTDMDNDGLVDLLVGGRLGNILYYHNNGPGNDPQWELVTNNLVTLTQGAISYSAPTATDLNGDGKKEIISGASTGKLFLFWNNSIADSLIFTQDTILFDSLNLGGYSRPFLGDLNNDGLFDLLVGVSSGQVHCFINQGTPESPDFSEGELFEGFDIGSYAAPFAADVDGDCVPDLFVGGNNGGLNFWSSVGTVTITPLDTLCSDAGIVSLSVISETEGAWSGDVDASGNFNTTNGSGLAIYTVINSWGCPQSDTLIINVADPLQINGMVTDASNGENNGSIDITILGDDQNYSFNWSNNAATIDLENLTPGDYTLTVTNSAGCASVASFIVQNQIPVDPIILSVGHEEGNSDSTIQIPVYAENWDAVVGFTASFYITDPTVALFSGISAAALSGITFNQVNDQTLAFAWYDLNTTGVSLPDSSILFFLEIELTGAPGVCSLVEIIGAPTEILAIQLNNTTTVTAQVITNPGEVCILSLVDISGEITREDNTPVNQVEVYINDMLATSTDMAGYYEIVDLTANFSYVIDPLKTGDYLNGVDILDVIKIQQHILGEDLFDSPYTRIAADVDENNSINLADITRIIQLLLGIITEFPEVDSWRFVPKAYEFPNPQNPFSPQFPGTINLENLVFDAENQDFIGIKMGDVTLDNNPRLDSDRLDERVSQDMLFYIVDRPVGLGEELIINLNVSEFKQISGFQMALVYEPEIFEFQDVFSEALPGFNQINSIENSIVDGIIPLVWVDPLVRPEGFSLQEGATVISLKFKSKKRISSLKNQLKLDHFVLSPIAYTSAEVPFNIAVKLQEIDRDLILYPSFPNPFYESTDIQFSISEQEVVEFTIYDQSGVIIWSHKQQFLSGYHEFKLNSEILPKSGIYIYQVKIIGHQASGKLIFHK